MENQNERSENQHERAVNQPAPAYEMQQIVHLAAEPARAGDSVKAQIGRAARALGLTHWRATAFWYAEARQVLADEADRMRAWREVRQARRRATLLAEIERLDRMEANVSKQIQDQVHAP